MKTSFRALLACLTLALVPGFANATLWVVDEVLTGSGVPGFGASLYHAASDGAPMSGATLASITGSGNLGTFDDATGILNVTMNLSTGGTTTLSNAGGTGMFFTAAGTELTTAAAVTATAASLGLADDIWFPGGNLLCCSSGSIGPNSFISDGAGGMIMTLWGANGWNSTSGFAGGGDTTIGIDIRLHFRQVPEPSALLLLLAGLGGLALARKRGVA